MGRKILIGPLVLVMASSCCANTMWFHEVTAAKTSPVSNFESAMEGYDVVKADPFATPDPGLRKKIFDPLYQSSGRTYLRSFVDAIQKDHQCDDKFEIVTVTSLDQFQEEKMKGYTYFIEPKVQKKNEQQIIISKPLKFVNLLYGTANCITTTVDIALFEKPVFTENFKNALATLYQSSKTPWSIRSKTTAIAFFQTFGTHFLQSSKLGSKIVFWNKHGDQSESIRNGEKKASDSQCLNDEVSQILMKSSGNITLATKNFISSSSKCGEISSENEFEEVNYEDPQMKIKNFLIFGTLPKQTMNSWGEEVVDAPVLVSFRLMKLSYFFRDEWLDFLVTNQTTQKLDTETLYEFFENEFSSYCRKYLKERCVDDQTDESFLFKKHSSSSTIPSYRKKSEFVNDEVAVEKESSRQIRQGNTYLNSVMYFVA